MIVPVYNGAATLAGCLDAIYASRYPDFEVVVVDDGSKDATRQVASRYPCRVLALPQNRGAAQAKNEGAQVATGEFLFFTDADVHIQPQTLAWVAEDLRDPAVTGVVGLLADSCPHANFASQFKNLWMHFTYRRQPRRVGLFFTSAAAIRRAIFAQEGGFDAHYRGASITEDIEFGQRLLSRGHQIVMDQRLAVEHDKHYTAGEVLAYRPAARSRPDADVYPQPAHIGKARPLRVGALVLWRRSPVYGLGHHARWFLPWSSARRAGFWARRASLLAALALNAPFLLALGRLRGPLFLLQSAGFHLGRSVRLGPGHRAWGFYDFVQRAPVLGLGPGYALHLLWCSAV